MHKPTGGRPNRHVANSKRRAFLTSDAPTIEAAMDECGLNPRTVIRLLDKLGLKQQLAVLVSVEESEQQAA